MSNNKKLVTLDVMQEFNEKKTKNIFVATDGSTAIQGNLIVSGSTTTQDTETLAVKDNIIVANADGANLIENAGFVIKTNSIDAYGITYDPVGDGVKIGLGSLNENGKFNYTEGEDQFLATRSDTIVDGNIPQWDDTKKEFVDSGKSIGDIVNEFSQIFNTEESWEEVANGTYTSAPMGDFGNAYGMTVLYRELQEEIPTMLKVELDGITYSNLTLTETGNAGYAAGNLSKLNSLMGTDYEDTGEPFIIGVGGEGGCLFATDLTQSTTHDIKVYFFIENATKIDGKYLHKPDWNQSDSTQPDYIKNRPFYEDNKVIASWNFDNLSSRDQFSFEDMLFYKISDDSQDLQTNFVEGAELEVFGYMEGSPSWAKLFVVEGPEIGCYIATTDTQVPAVIYIFDKENFPLPVPSNGLYVIYYAQDNTIVAAVQKILGWQIKKLDEKFLPDDILRTADKEELNSNITSLGRSMSSYDQTIKRHSTEISDIHDDIDDIRNDINTAGKVLIATFNITSENMPILIGHLSGTIKIDWGDGSSSIEFNDLSNDVTSHIYSNPGEYICKIYGVTSIGNKAFYGYDNLTEIIIPDSVTTIGNHAFYNCSSLTSITIPDSVTSIDEAAFDKCTNLKSIAIGAGVTSIGDYVFWDCENLTSVVIGDGVTSIGDREFDGCDSLTSIVIPDSVTSIGDSMFFGCSNLTSVVIGAGVTSIGEYMFYDCSKLASIVIPNSVTSIGNSAFFRCSSLTSVVIPDSVTSIGEKAFDECDSLTSVVIGDSVTSVDNFAFSSCGSLMSVNIPNSVTSIGSHAFSDSGLTSIVLGDGITSIGDSAFDYCSLTNVVIPENVTAIGNWAFYYCDDLMNVTFKSATPPTIGASSFFKRNKFTHIYVPYDCGQAYKEKWAADGADQSILDLIIESDREAMMSDLNNIVGDINTALETILGV